MLTATQLAMECGADLIGPEDVLLASVAPMEIAGSYEISWINDFIDVSDALQSSRATAILVPRGIDVPKCSATILTSNDFTEAKHKVLDLLDNIGATNEYANGSAQFGANVAISPSAVIGETTRIGDGSRIGPNCVIGPGARIGSNCKLSAGSSIGNGTRIGNGCRVGENSIIGAQPDAHEWGPDGPRLVASCHIVILGDGVNVGAASQIQKGVERNTIVGSYVSIGAQCGLGHDCRVGQHTIIGAQSGIAAYCNIGERVQINVQVGITNNIRVGDHAKIGAKSGVMHDIPRGETWWGIPAAPKTTALRRHVVLNRLADKKGKRN